MAPTVSFLAPPRTGLAAEAAATSIRSVPSRNRHSDHGERVDGQSGRLDALAGLARFEDRVHRFVVERQPGQLAAGIERMRHGIRISPRDRRPGFWGWALSEFLLQSGHDEEALAEVRVGGKRDARLHLTRVVQAAALHALGQATEAAEALAAARRLRPGLTMAEVERAHGRRVVELLRPVWG